MKRQSNILKCLLCLFLFISTILLSALDDHYPVTGEQMASSGLNLLAPSPGTVFLNPAIASTGVSFAYSIPFFMPDISVSAFSCQSTWKHISMGIGSQYINEADYHENASYLNLQYISKNVIIGSNARYLWQKTDEYRSINAFMSDFGIRVKYDPFQTAWVIRNAGKSKEGVIPLPESYQSEFAWNISKLLIISTGIEKKNDMEYMAGIRIAINPQLRIINSYQFESHQLAFGAIINTKQYSINYGVKFHPYLNPSHSITIHYQFSKSN
ncbi:MAG TPA: hypothetical protein PKJ08_10145 [Candidatus Cloacimonadota bacterium]|jgi:hypothetical protein|nr:hypothetical protein [Candidatus Cloacimonadota bacterium]